MFVLADTSIWISFLNADSPQIADKMNELIREDKICICPPIYQEILQGVKTIAHFKKLEKLLQNLHQIKQDSYIAARGAAEIYFRMRKKGISVRKSYDCLIAWYAIEADAVLYHNDKDFEKIATVFPLKTVI